jgi:hypothetical protein
MADEKRTNDQQAMDKAPNTKDANAAGDLPERNIGEKDADAVKGGLTTPLSEKF